MTYTVAVQGWMRTIGPREQAAVTARTHVAAETSERPDVDEICATVSADAFFAAPVRTRAGQEIPPGTVLTDPAQVRGYYSARAEGYIVTGSAELKVVTTDWYMFRESAASLLGTGDIGGVPAAGKEFVVNSAVLFPTAPDGIRGEIAVTRYPFSDIVTGDLQLPPPPPDDRRHLPSEELANWALEDRLLQAARSDDRSALLDVLSERHSLAVRVDDEDGRADVLTATSASEAAAALARVFAGATDISLLTRVTTPWYVFAEYLIQRPSGSHGRLAAIQPVDGGRFIGTFGYGFAGG